MKKDVILTWSKAYMSHISSGAQFAAIVYDDRIKQRGAAWQIRWNFYVLLVSRFCWRVVSHVGRRLLLKNDTARECRSRAVSGEFAPCGLDSALKLSGGIHNSLSRCFSEPVTTTSITPLPTGERSTVMRWSVCACVCLSVIVSSELHVRSSPYWAGYSWFGLSLAA